LRIGDWDVTTIDSGRFGLDGGAMFGIVPKPLWERRILADDENRIELGMRLLLARGHDRTVLVDTGIGDKFPEKEREIYRIDPAFSSLDRALEAAGVDPGSITDVVLTHLHFDHAGGATRRDADGALRPSFPKARHWIQRANLDWARNPSDRDRGSYLAENFEPLAEAGCLEILDGPEEPFPGFSLDVVHGHTFGQQLPRIEGDGRTLAFLGDLVPTAAHVPIPWVMGYDLQPLETVREKHALYERATAGDWLLVLEHDAATDALRLRRGERGVEIAERTSLTAGD